MNRFFKATLRGIYKVISSILLVFFPPDPDVGPSYYRQTTQDHSEYLPAAPQRGLIRTKHIWRPPLVEHKLPVED